MTGQATLFDLAESQRRRDEGIARAAAGRESWLCKARELAVSICKEKGDCTADDLRAAGLETPPNTSFNIFGGIFNDRRFVWTGEFRKSERPIAHTNLLRVWKLRPPTSSQEGATNEGPAGAE